MSEPSDYSASDRISAGFIATPSVAAMIEKIGPVLAIALDALDAIVVAGGQAPMVTFGRATSLNERFVAFYEVGELARCHRAAILRYARPSDGSYLSAGKTVTGFASIEEDFADHAVWSVNLQPRTST
jgi:putative intracellular protease/amidase